MWYSLSWQNATSFIHYDSLNGCSNSTEKGKSIFLSTYTRLLASTKCERIRNSAELSSSLSSLSLIAHCWNCQLWDDENMLGCDANVYDEMRWDERNKYKFVSTHILNRNFCRLNERKYIAIQNFNLCDAATIHLIVLKSSKLLNSFPQSFEIFSWKCYHNAEKCESMKKEHLNSEELFPSS